MANQRRDSQHASGFNTSETQLMHTTRRILVAVKDPVARSLPAVMKAAQLASALGAHLELFHCIKTPLFVELYGSDGTLESIARTILRQQRERLERLARKLREQGHDGVSAHVQWDYPVFESIIRRANETRADLIVSERHAGRHITPGLLQLTDWELLRNSPVPVLLVKTAGVYQKPVVLAAVDPSHANAKPGNLDEHILHVAAMFSETLRGSLHAVHSYIPLPTPFPNDLRTQGAVRALTSDIEAKATRRFDRLLRSTDISNARRHLRAQHPINAIEDTARKLKSSIVVMGALSRSGLKRLFIGNTAESLLDSLACDFLIVKPDHFESAAQRRRRGARSSTSAAPAVA
jgi:universal stress protein E